MDVTSDDLLFLYEVFDKCPITLDDYLRAKEIESKRDNMPEGYAIYKDDKWLFL